VAGRVLTVLGCGIMHPAVRERMPSWWGRSEDLQFRVLARLLQVAFRRLPTFVTDTPMARNRRQYRRLVDRYRAVGLPSFAPDARQVSPSGR
jgi:uncharacterized protein (DUF2236 family)